MWKVKKHVQQANLAFQNENEQWMGQYPFKKYVPPCNWTPQPLSS